MNAPRRVPRVDGRLFVLANNAILLALGMALTGLQRDVRQLLLALFAGLASEVLLARFTKKHAQVRWGDRALSASVTAVSTMVLVRSDRWWFYGALTALAILSKYVIVDEERRHVFNPTNLAIALAVAVLPDFIQVRPDDFSSWPLYWAIIPSFGVLAAFFGARWRTTAGYYAGILLGIPLGHFSGLRPLWVVAPELNTSTLIFAFLMLTDPKATPSAPRAQLLFGLVVAAVHLEMRYHQIPYSPFVSLFAVTAVRSVLRPPSGGHQVAIQSL